MEHHFTLSVVYKEDELSFPCRLATFGYTYTFYVVVNKHEIMFEQDEEMNLRAINLDNNTQDVIEKDLWEAICFALGKREFLQVA